MTRPILFVNPLSDADFVALAEGWVQVGVDGPEHLERVLRRRYPNAVVRVRDISGENATVWYVYRDGHWTRDDQSHA